MTVPTRETATRFVVVGFLLAFTIGGTPAPPASPWVNLAKRVFVRVDTTDLPAPDVEALAQDSLGFIWVGMQGGLARFSGYRFQSFVPDARDPRALPDANIETIVPDSSGDLWLGTGSRGLVHYDALTETFRTWRADPRGRAGPRSTTVNAIALEKDGSLWVGGDAGLDRFDPRSGTFEPANLAARGAGQPLVTAILVARQGTVWVATTSGLYASEAGQAFRKVDLGTGSPRLFSLFEDSRGRIWTGSVNAAYALDANGRVQMRLASSATDPASIAVGEEQAITEATPGVIWIGSNQGWLSVVDLVAGNISRIAGESRYEGGFGAECVRRFLRDTSGLIWVAGCSGGLFFHNPSKIGIFTVPAGAPSSGLNDTVVRTIAAASGERLWAAGLDGSLVELDARAGRLRSVELPKDRVFALTLLPQTDGGLWIGTRAGLCYLAPSQASATCPAGPTQIGSSCVRAILNMGTGLLFGTEAGLVPAPAGAAGAALGNREVFALLRDRRGRLWVGTNDGLVRIDRRGRTAVRFAFDPADPNSIGPGVIASLLEDRRGWIWAGTIGGPLNVLQDAANGSTRVRHMGLADGLPNENVDALAEDARGHLWASTDKGIALIDPLHLRARGFGFADGASMIGSFGAGAVATTADGTILFGGQGGITAIAPVAHSEPNFSPPLVVTSLAIGHRPQSVGAANLRPASLILPAGSRDVTVEFAALDYTAPRTLRYAYELEGYDRAWIDADASHRIATYTNLAPGDYTLRVRATNRSGDWSPRSLALHLRALPMWYETWWFRSLLAALAFAALVLIFRARTVALQRRARALEVVVDARTRQLSQANDELRLGEVAVVQSQERFRSLFDQSPYAICSILPDGTVTAMNTAMQHLTGYAPEELVGKNILSLVSPVRLDASVARREEIARGKVMQFETVIRSMEGTDFHAIVDTSPIIVGNALEGVFITIKDATRDRALGRSTKDAAERITALYRVASSTDVAAATQIDQTLLVVAKALEMPYGFVTRVVDGITTIMHRHGPGDLLPVGFTMPVVSSIGGRLSTSPRAIAIEDLSVEPYASELRERGLPWKSYIGSRIAVESVPYGALILLDTSPRATPFEPTDFDFIDLASWLVGNTVAREIHQQQMEDLAFHDRLTGLANRRVLEDHLRHALAYARRTGSAVAVHYADLNDFKPINDRYGHTAGDEVLCEVARRFSDVLRGQDILARVGGDEFVAVQTAEAGEKDAIDHLVRRLRQSLEKPIALSNGAGVTVGASFGVAIYPNDGETFEELLEAADLTMLANKPGQPRSPYPR